MKRLLAALLTLFLMLGLGAGGAYLYAISALGAPSSSDSSEVEFTVPKGANSRDIGKLLAEQIVPAHAPFGAERLWRFHVWKRGGLRAKAGRFMLRRDMNMFELATALESTPLPEDVPFVVVEGWRLRDTDAALAEKGFLKAGAYLEAASSPARLRAPFKLPERALEGYLYPETYRIPKEGLDATVLVQRQLDTFVERVFAPHQEEIQHSSRTLHELVTLASILEREEPSPDQRPLVAGILWKRLDRGIPLGVDATSRYGIDEWNDRKQFLVHLRNADDEYNTRTRRGLPPTPIGSPTEASFASALRPNPSDFLYYLHDSEKRLHPSRNAQEHEALRKRYNVY